MIALSIDLLLTVPPVVHPSLGPLSAAFEVRPMIPLGCTLILDGDPAKNSFQATSSHSTMPSLEGVPVSIHGGMNPNADLSSNGLGKSDTVDLSPAASDPPSPHSIAIPKPKCTHHHSTKPSAETLAWDDQVA